MRDIDLDLPALEVNMDLGRRPATGLPLAAWTRSPTSCEPTGWTVRNSLAGARTFAPSGNAKRLSGATAQGDRERNQRWVLERVEGDSEAVALAVGLTRNSTRSAALLA